MLVASLFYAAYAVALRQRPPVSALAFFTAMSAIATITSTPLLAGEILLGQVQWPTMKGWLVMSYIIVFPSLLAQVFFIRAVAMIGPGRASLFYNLVPVLGAIMAVTLLGEPFAPYHAAGLALALGGVDVQCGAPTPATTQQGCRHYKSKSEFNIFHPVI
jgi:drug/metabolite transporter (DMT)-like permease